jgi:group I intron endonuclease
MIIYGIYSKIKDKIVYVGQTKRELHHRIDGHRKAMKIYDTILARAFRKYGFNNFEFIILKNDVKNIQELDKLEKHFIEVYKTYPCGSGAYNQISGGHNHNEFSEIYLQKLSDSQKKRYEDPEERKKHGQRMKQMYIDNPDARKKQSENNQQRYKNVNERLKTGKASKLSYEKHPERIQEQAAATRQRYINNPELREVQSIRSKTDERYIKGRNKAHQAVMRKIICVEKNQTFNSIASAAEFFKVKAPGISQALRKNSLCKGFHFKYLTEEEKMTETILKQLEDNGYSAAIAVATQAEIKAGAACGQLSIITQ